MQNISIRLESGKRRSKRRRKSEEFTTHKETTNTKWQKPNSIMEIN